MLVQHRAIFRGFGADAPSPHCLPVVDGYPVLGTNPYCKDGWGWLNEGECGCTPGSPAWDAARKGCSVKCAGVGENSCPECKKPINWMLVGGVGVGVLAVLALLRKR